jgi:hypothetical protein
MQMRIPAKVRSMNDFKPGEVSDLASLADANVRRTSH